MLARWLSSRQTNAGSPEFEKASGPAHVRMNISGGDSAVKIDCVKSTF